MQTINWHERFQQQARWTESARAYFFNQLQLPQDARILETGCGSGVITTALESTFPQWRTFGIDILFDRLSFAGHQNEATGYIQADGNHLPFKPSSFHVTFCHYYLLWLADPVAALNEMSRVTYPGGYVAALAEPDYGGRINYPDNLEHLADLQTLSLMEKGADPFIGRKLAQLFKKAHLDDIHVCLLGGQWQEGVPLEDFELEWDILRSDLTSFLSTNEIEHHYLLDKKAWQTGRKIQYVPTFFAWGKVPQTDKTR